MPRVGTTAEFERLIRDYETQDGRVHATFKPASWVSVVVRFRPAGQESPTDVWAAELAVQSSTFVVPDRSRALDDRARARMTIYWRFGARGTVELYGISREFRRHGAVLSDNTAARRSWSCCTARPGSTWRSLPASPLRSKR